MLRIQSNTDTSTSKKEAFVLYVLIVWEVYTIYTASLNFCLLSYSVSPTTILIKVKWDDGDSLYFLCHVNNVLINIPVVPTILQGR